MVCGRPQIQALFLLLPLLAGLSACDDGLQIHRVDPQLAYVGEFFQLEIEVSNKGGYTLWFEGPDLPGLDRWAALVDRPGGGEFQWTPQADHVGVHTFTFIADDGRERARRDVIIDVRAAREGVPVFRAPSPVVALDLAVEPCLVVPIVADDLDTPAPSLRVLSGLPTGAVLESTGPGEATLSWCPTPDQVAAAEHWVVRLEARDGEHEPVVRDLRVVLVAEQKSGCPGGPPVVRWLFPEEGEWVESFVGYDVGISVESTRPLRDPPVLFYTRARIDPRERLDLSTFDAAAFEWTEDHWVAHVPSFNLAEDEFQTLTMVAWVTDNADPSGTRCDRRAEPLTRRIVAVGAVEAGVLPECAACAQSGDCSSGACLPTPSGGRCVPACRPKGVCVTGTCSRRNAAEGVLRWACGEVVTVCEGLAACADDSREDNDERSAAAPIGDGIVEAMLCDGDPDLFAIAAGGAARVSLSVDAGGESDLELRVTDAHGAIVALTGGANPEPIERCTPGGEPLYAEVLAPRGGRVPYALAVTSTAESCACIDDDSEPDSAEAPVVGVVGTTFEGRICPGNTDYFAIPGATGQRTHILLEIPEQRADLDFDVVGPGGERVGASRSVEGDEWLEADLAGTGRYLLRVFAFDARPADYRLTITRERLTACDAPLDCELGESCLDGRCRRLRCQRDADCPDGHGCPGIELGRDATCSPDCAADYECPEGWRCKPFAATSACVPEGPGETGASCLGASDCAGRAVCLDWPGGYCAVTGCSAAWDCELGDVCAVIDGRSACLRDCWTDDALCLRDAPYVCDELIAPDNDVVFGCFPESR